jgi:hypothetical protein
MASFTLTQEQYEALVALARAGAVGDNLANLEAWLRLIETANGITRDFVLVQWQEQDSALPPGTRFPEVWPPELRRSIEYVTRRVAKSDVESMLTEHARSPINVLCTKDPQGKYGWTPIDDFFVV